MPANWPRNRKDIFADPYAAPGAPASSMDFSQADPEGGAEVNRKMAQMAMRRKRPMANPDDAIAKSFQDEILKHMVYKDSFDPAKGQFPPASISNSPTFVNYGSLKPFMGDRVDAGRTPYGVPVAKLGKLTPAQLAWLERMKAENDRKQMMQALAQNPDLAQ